ncbi:putative major facilitator superfamily transporter [Gordonia effusa NBRC 100432]|uniref:Putative major facilitator superfamily transporter n=1 Tax=Gordonia effusa NBRC 100432 TaxID=1077974 RepID=H0QW73_9ACTN|nr:MFS transporter [Gordonia effusa]GAB17074.1 putative major facilitator superfamily transporter [Gordonia effusa NBRC 100432]
MTSSTGTQHISRLTYVGYAAGSVGTGGFGVLPGLVLAFYLTDTLAVTAILASFVVLLPKIIDVVLNPVIGSRSDADMQRIGTRRRLMLLGALAIAPLFLLTFSAPTAWPPWAAAIWVLVAFSLTAVAFSCFQVPYIALPADLTDDYHERTRLVSGRIAVLAATILVVGAGGPAIRDAVGGAPGYAVMGLAVGLLISAGMLLATLWAAWRRAIPHRETSPHGSYRAAFSAVTDGGRFPILLSVYVIQALASAIPLAGAPYLAKYVLERDGAVTLLFVALVAPAIVVMPVWSFIGQRIGKLAALRWASVIFAVAMLALLGAGWWDGPWVYVPICIAGAGYAGMQIFPLALLPDIIDERSDRVGADQGGAISGLWTACEAVGLALGPAAFLAVLAATGFISSSGDETVAQPDTAAWGIVIGFSVLPAALVLVTLVVLRRMTDTALESLGDNR